MLMYVTLSDLLQLMLLVATIIKIVYDITKKH